MSRSTTMFTFPIPRGFWVEDLFVVRDTSGEVVASPAFTVAVNDVHGTVTFAASVTGERTIDLAVFDWHMAAASVWQQKAEHRFDYINFKAADHRFDMETERKACESFALYHRSKRVRSFPRTPKGFTPTPSSSSTRRSRP